MPFHVGVAIPVTKVRLLRSYVLRSPESDRLREEQKLTTNPHAGLHVFEPRKPGGIRDQVMSFNSDTYGAATLADVQTVLELHASPRLTGASRWVSLQAS